MKKHFLLLCLLTACIGSLMAGPVDQQKAKKLGTKFLSTTTLAQKNVNIPSPSEMPMAKRSTPPANSKTVFS